MSNTATGPSDTHRWRDHIRATLILGLPLIGAQLATIGLGVTDTVMLGWLGAETLAGGVLGTQLYFICFLTGSGIANAVAPIVANGVGAGDDRAVRRAVRMGLWASVIFALLTLPLMLSGEAIYLALGQVPETAAIAGTYLQVAAWSLAFNLGQSVMRAYLASVDRAGIVLWASLAGLLLNAALNWAFIFGNWGAPALGVTGAAIATFGTNILLFAILAAYAMFQPVIRRFQIFVRLWKPDFQALRDVVRVAWPISLSSLAEVSLFAMAAIMIGWIGTIELAAHGIAMQIISVFFMLPLGLTFAATVRVGQADGRQDREGIIRSAMTATGLTILLGVLGAIALVIFARPLLGLFLDEGDPNRSAVIAFGVPLLMVAALFQVADGLQLVAAGSLRGLKDTAVPMMIAVASYLGLAVPLAYILAFPLGFGGVGVWSGLAVGLTVAAVLLLGRFRVMTRPKL